MIELILVNGAFTSSIFALLALGFSLVFGVARILLLCYTAFYMVSAYLLFILATTLGMGLYLSAILAIVFTILIAIVVYRISIHPVREHELSVLIISVAIAIILSELILILYGGHFRGLPSFITGAVEILGVKLVAQRALTLPTTFILVFAIWIFLSKTRIGNAIRATSQDREAASLMGINVTKISMMTIGLSGFFAATAGILVAPLQVATPFMWMDPLVIVLACVVLGGLGSLKGSIIGAFILGYTQVGMVALNPEFGYLKSAVALLVMVAVLVIRPEGLFGVTFEEER